MQTKEEQNKKSTYSHILKYTSLFGSIQFLGILLGILKNKFVAVILGPSGLGLISLFNSTINFVSNATNLGISTSAVKNISEAFDHDDERRITKEMAIVRSWSFLTAIFGTLVCIIFSKILNDITFSWGSHTLHFICLSPIVGLMAITLGEVAILKATRNLKRLAIVSIYNMVFAIIVSVPIYYFFGESGIVPSLVILALLQMLVTIFYSYRLYPLKIVSSIRQLSYGFTMVKLGIAFVVAGILVSGAEFLIRSYLSHYASLETVGLYSAGYLIVMTYGGMIFSSMEADYYPRLSAASKKDNFTEIVNNQSEVSLLLISPLLVAFMFLAPLLLPLLYSGKFSPAIGMVQVATLALYIRAAKLPVSYISLAKGNSILFMIIDGQYAFFIVIACILGFNLGGLIGIGYAITIVGLIDYAIILLLMWKIYGYKMSRDVRKYLLLQYPIGIVSLCVILLSSGWIYWTIGLVLIILSTWISLRVLYRKTQLLDALRSKFKSKGS